MTKKKIIIVIVLGIASIAVGFGVAFLINYFVDGLKAPTYQVVVPENMKGADGKLNLPAGVVTPEKAVETVTQIPGYTMEMVSSVEAVSGEVTGNFYWAAETDNGYVTVRGKK